MEDLKGSDLRIAECIHLYCNDKWTIEETIKVIREIVEDELDKPPEK